LTAFAFNGAKNGLHWREEKRCGVGEQKRTRAVFFVLVDAPLGGNGEHPFETFDPCSCRTSAIIAGFAHPAFAREPLRRRSPQDPAQALSLADEVTAAPAHPMLKKPVSQAARGIPDTTLVVGRPF
jgi:hypothetical protein